MIGWVIGISVFAALGITGGIGWSKLMNEHREARDLPLAEIDFGQLNDGSYHGAYGGGMYKWRTNECQVTVSSGKVTDVQLVSSKESANNNTMHKEIYDRVIKAQSLQVDAISGATLTTRAYLKGIENALLQAEQ